MVALAKDSGTSWLHRVAFAIASAAVHVWLVVASRIFADAIPFGDLSLYNWWVYQVEHGQPLYGVIGDWVYPAAAFIPMLVASFFGTNFEIAWVSMVYLLNTLAALSLWRVGEKQQRTGGGAAWLFLAALVALGPVAISRIDSISAALALFGLAAVVLSRLSLAASIFTVAGWVKIWPVALFAAMVTAYRNFRMPVFIAAGISLGIIGLALLLGGDASIFSFFTSQQDRGIQIESVIATPWLWLASLGDAKIYFDDTYITNQVSGIGVEIVARLSTPALLIALAITCYLAFRAFRLGRDSSEVFAWAALTGVLDLIVFNKVGSPQFMLWLAIPLVTFALFRTAGRSAVIGIGLLILFLTQLIYPVWYIELLGLNPLALGLITARNALLVVLLVVANLGLGGQKFLQQRPDSLRLN